MLRRSLLVPLIFVASLAPAAAQLVPEPADQAPASCPNRPADPVIIENMDFRDAHRVIFIRDMYRAYTFNNVVESGACGCEQRYPSWEPVVQYYLEHYAGIEDRHELREHGRAYDNTIQAYRGTAREICLAAGTWR